MINKLKQKLKNGEKTIGTWISIPSPDVSEALSTLPFDWFLFDMEHAALNEQSAQILMQGMRNDDVTPLVRVAWNDPVLIKKALDIGAHGVLVPMVNTKEDAEKVVQACTYPPSGIRGCGPKRPIIYDPDYIATADEEVLPIIQIETEEAVNNADKIFSVEGIDVFFIGTFDLSVSMGFRGDKSQKRYQEAIDHVFEMAKKHNVAAGMWEGGGKTSKERLDEGWQFISIGIDIQFLLAGCREGLKDVGRMPAENAFK
jgi:2-keto-3-deoxy-L-rhamnonate aldolase RhmA